MPSTIQGGRSNIKRDYILNYLKERLNETTQEIEFMMGLDGMPLYSPISAEAGRGDMLEFEFVNDETYKRSLKNYVAVSIPVITADYASIATIERDKQIKSSTWSASISFLVYTGSYAHNKLMFAMEEFRDKLLARLDLMEGREWDYDSPQTDPVVKYYNIATTASDVSPGSYIIINGKEYVEYTISVDIDISKDLSYGNQFEFFIAKETSEQFEWVFSGFTTDNEADENFEDEDELNDNPPEEEGLVALIEHKVELAIITYKKYVSKKVYERVLPLQVSWGASNSLEGQQLLNNALSEVDMAKAKMIHNVVASRGWAINFTFLFQPTGIIKELFKETYIMKEVMNDVYKILTRFKNIGFDDDGDPFFYYDNSVGFEYDCVVGEAATEVIYGDTIMFSIGFALSWEPFEVEEEEGGQL